MFGRCEILTIYAEILSEKSSEDLRITRSEESSPVNQRTAILLVLDGGGDLVCDATFTISAGSIAVIPPGVDYYFKSSSEYRILSISGIFDKPIASDGVKLLRDNIYGEGRKLAELILYNRFGNENYLGKLCDAYIEYILLNLDRAPKNTTAAIYKIISRMEKDFGNSDLSVSKLLDESGYARDYIRTEFQAITKTTPKKHLNNIRMKNAKAMIELYGNDISISEIAEKCGIIDPSIFSRIYKKHHGISPTQYRDSLKKTKSIENNSLKINKWR